MSVRPTAWHKDRCTMEVQVSVRLTSEDKNKGSQYGEFSQVKFDNLPVSTVQNINWLAMVQDRMNEALISLNEKVAEYNAWVEQFAHIPPEVLNKAVELIDEKEWGSYPARGQEEVVELEGGWSLVYSYYQEKKLYFHRGMEGERCLDFNPRG